MKYPNFAKDVARKASQFSQYQRDHVKGTIDSDALSDIQLCLS
jgi:hypothetical protein